MTAKRLKLSRPSVSSARVAGPQLKQPGERVSGLNGAATLENLGNTCYLNAVLQVLFQSPDFRSALQRHRAAQTDAPSTHAGAESPTQWASLPSILVAPPFA